MPPRFTHRFLNPAEKLPAKETISAVFLLAFQDGKLLSIKNDRGWDIPGGHIEGDEEPFAALQREVLEEAGAEINSAVPYAILTSTTSSKIMAFFASNDIELVGFTPSEDALSRDLLNSQELLDRYYGDKNLLQSLIDGGRRRLGLS